MAVVTQSFSGTGAGTPSTGVGIKGTANLTLGGTSPVGTVKLEKSYDNGTTWFDVSLDSLGTVASWVLGASTEISVLFEEPEAYQPTTLAFPVLYRCNCTAYTSGTITARIGQ
jgi:hypothetical protein